MARFCSLFSSSSGNCTYVGGASGGILIDCGVSAKRVTLALDERGIDPKSIAAIFITHEHTDHISGVRVFGSKYNIPVFATEGTLDAMIRMGAVGEKNRADVISKNGVEVNGMFVRPFATPHDTRESCGYTIVTGDSKRISVCTDLGHITDDVLNGIYGSDLVLLESNHDVNMLRCGPYPYDVKRRILSDFGHLSNEVCAETAVKLLEGGTTRLFLGHLSHENNLPDLALSATRCAMTQSGAHENSDYLLNLAGYDTGITAF